MNERRGPSAVPQAARVRGRHFSHWVDPSEHSNAVDKLTKHLSYSWSALKRLKGIKPAPFLRPGTHMAGGGHISATARLPC